MQSKPTFFPELGELQLHLGVVSQLEMSNSELLIHQFWTLHPENASWEDALANQRDVLSFRKGFFSSLHSCIPRERQIF